MCICNTSFDFSLSLRGYLPSSPCGMCVCVSAPLQALLVALFPVIKIVCRKRATVLDFIKQQDRRRSLLNPFGSWRSPPFGSYLKEKKGRELRRRDAGSIMRSKVAFVWFRRYRYTRGLNDAFVGGRSRGFRARLSRVDISLRTYCSERETII